MCGDKVHYTYWLFIANAFWQGGIVEVEISNCKMKLSLFSQTNTNMCKENIVYTLINKVL